MNTRAVLLSAACCIALASQASAYLVGTGKLRNLDTRYTKKLFSTKLDSVPVAAPSNGFARAGKADITGPAADVNLMVSLEELQTLLAAVTAAGVCVLQAAQGLRNEPFYFTDAPVQICLQGYASPGQLAAGRHTRLYARAFLVADQKDDRSVSVMTRLFSCRKTPMKHLHPIFAYI